MRALLLTLALVCCTRTPAGSNLDGPGETGEAGGSGGTRVHGAGGSGQGEPGTCAGDLTSAGWFDLRGHLLSEHGGDPAAMVVDAVGAGGLVLADGSTQILVPWPGAYPDDAFAAGDVVTVRIQDGWSVVVEGATSRLVLALYGFTLGWLPEELPPLAGLPAVRAATVCEAPPDLGGRTGCRIDLNDRIADMIATWEGTEVRLRAGEGATLGPWRLHFAGGFQVGAFRCDGIFADGIFADGGFAFVYAALRGTP